MAWYALYKWYKNWSRRKHPNMIDWYSEKLNPPKWIKLDIYIDAAVQTQRGRNTMNRNECLNCKYYEKCGKPSRPVKCMGYEKGDNRNETLRETRRHVSSTDS